MDCNDVSLYLLIAIGAATVVLFLQPKWEFPAVIDFLIQYASLCLVVNLLLWGVGRDYLRLVEKYVPLPSYLWAAAVVLVLTILLRLARMSLELAVAVGFGLLVANGLPFRAALPVAGIGAAVLFLLTMVRRLRKVGKLIFLTIALALIISCCSVGIADQMDVHLSELEGAYPLEIESSDLFNSTAHPQNCTLQRTTTFVACHQNCYSILGDNTEDSMIRIIVTGASTAGLTFLRLLVFSIFYNSEYAMDNSGTDNDRDIEMGPLRSTRKKRRRKRKSEKKRGPEWRELSEDDTDESDGGEKTRSEKDEKRRRGG